mmetsp:Transcript_45710/g.106642  ORF Transcript_45710/g.106642 Transcript_45710/m.106642 type:complete len:203 (+) Transcript_45710:487-1095(+)
MARGSTNVGPSPAPASAAAPVRSVIGMSSSACSHATDAPRCSSSTGGGNEAACFLSNSKSPRLRGCAAYSCSAETAAWRVSRHRSRSKLPRRYGLADPLVQATLKAGSVVLSSSSVPVTFARRSRHTASFSSSMTRRSFSHSEAMVRAVSITRSAISGGRSSYEYVMGFGCRYGLLRLTPRFRCSTDKTSIVWVGRSSSCSR